MRGLGLVFLVLLFGCATTHAPYVRARMGRADEVGYLDKRIGDDEYAVAYLAPCRAPRQQALDLAMLRSSEIGVRDGFPFFALEDRREDTTAFDTGSTTVGVPIFNSVVITSHRNITTCPIFTLRVRYFLKPPHKGAELYQSGQVAAALSRKYGLNLKF